MSRVSKFLATAKPPKGGGKCKTCDHAKRKDIEADCREFNERRADGVTVTWGYFATEHLKPAYAYQLECRALIKHLEKCLGLEVH